jgi:uncharacterized protein (TIGR02271 family)
MCTSKEGGVVTLANTGTFQDLTGQPVVDTSGNKIGTVSQIYLDNETGQPEWVAVRTGMFKNKSSFVPLRGAKLEGDAVIVGYTKDLIKGAPQVADDGVLEPDQEQVLYDYYGQQYAPYAAQTPPVARERTSARPSNHTTTDNAMTRSEERIDVGTARQEVGRARLRKYVVTEDVHTTVPVSHEEVRVEREPISETNRGAALSGPEITEAEHEVVLTEERPVVQKQVVPVERVRLDKQTVTERAQVDDTVRKERIESTGVEGIDGDL